jgi:GH25 family lysozyme M1 (1,4-beta-N-acetylmuramidase)
MTERPIVTVDYYSGNGILPFQKLHDAYGITLFFRKFSMGGGPDIWLEKDVPLLRNAGGILGGTHWVDPTQNAKNQGDYFLYQINKWKPAVLLYDIEQWWAIWGRQNPGKKADGTDIDPHIPSQKILDSTATIVEYVNARAGLPYLLYTGRWFTISYCPQLGQWIGAQPAMLASYPDYYFLWPPAPAKPARLTYRPQDYSLLTPRPVDLLDYMARMDTKWMAVPTGVTNVKLWQITSRLVLPECNGDPYDYSRWLGDEADFRSFLRLDPSSTPIPPVVDARPIEVRLADLERRVGILEAKP